MRSRSVVVSGATGMLGSCVASDFAQRGWKVLCFARPASAKDGLLARAPSARFYTGDLLSREDVSDAISSSGADAFVNCAGKAPLFPFRAGRAELFSANVLAARAIAGACRESGVPLVHVSSVSAGLPGSGAYGRSKLLGEREIAASGLADFAVVRPSTIYDEAGRNDIARLVRAARSLPVIPLPYGGSCRLQPVRAADVSALVLALCERKGGRRGRLVEIGGGSVVTLRDIFRMILSGIGRGGVPIVPVPLPGRSAFLSAFFEDRTVDNSAAERILGRRTMPFRDGLSQVLGKPKSAR